MKKNGWGLRAELGFLLLFVVCIIISTIGLYRMGLLGNRSGNGIYEDFGQYTEGQGNFDYSELEQKVVDAAIKYYDDKYPFGSEDTIVVSVDTLKSNGFMSPIYDSRNKECKGYAKVLKTKTCVSYIKCSAYKTVGYSEEYE